MSHLNIVNFSLFCKRELCQIQFYMLKNQFFSVLLLGAGFGSRFGQDLPKQFQQLSGKPVIRYAIEVFLSHPKCNAVHAVINSAHHELYHDALHDLNLPSPIIGGESRKQSCYNGLKEIAKGEPPKIILVHDAARPFISHKDIDNLLQELEVSNSVSLGKPIVETIRRSDTQNYLTEKIDRTNCWALQTPQGFHFDQLLEAHEAFKENDAFTDDCGVMEAHGHKTKVIKRKSPNIKITWADDLEEAERIMSEKKITVTGHGFDVHAFGDVDVENIKLGGIDVPYHRNLKAHSDGDVVLHALTDAILGAIGEGDIGLHFPPSDNQWKNKDSRFFLEEASKMLLQKGGDINNVDITLICEKPKLKDMREPMRDSIASLLSLNPRQVNVKATTTEKLGFTGRGEGIACQATICANINRYETSE